MSDFEKLGQFYLGKEYDQIERKKTENLVLYDRATCARTPSLSG